jgi:hypothetical protein
VDKLVQRKENNTPGVLEHSHGLSEIARFMVQNRRSRMRYRFPQVFSMLDRSILLMMAGLFFSLSAFSQTTAGPVDPCPTSEHIVQFPAKLDETPVDPQVKLIVDRVAAARVVHPSDIEPSRRDYLVYSIFAVPPESAFRVEDRKIPGLGGNIPSRLYTTNARTGLPPWVFSHGDGFVAGRLETYDVPLRALTNGCDCPVVSAGYWLAPENRYAAAPESAYAATKWMAEHTAERDENPKTPLSATPPGIFGLPPMPGLPQTPASEADRAGGNINLTMLADRFRGALRFRRPN